MCLHLNLNTKLIDEDGVLDKRVIIFEDALLYLKQFVTLSKISLHQWKYIYFKVLYIWKSKNNRIASLFLRRQQILISTEINNSGM